MVRFRLISCLIISLVLLFSVASAPAEETEQEMEQGLDEIRPLMEMAEVEEKKGMGLEEITDAFSLSAMSEYHEDMTGFSIQYPSIFQFDDEQEGNIAYTADHRASLSIDNMVHQDTLTEESLLQMIRWDVPEAEPVRNEQNGCLRVDRTAADGTVCVTDLYLLTSASFHHIVITYPKDEQEIYSQYIEYMINTMESKNTDLG